jgi:hypothetical protein
MPVGVSFVAYIGRRKHNSRPEAKRRAAKAARAAYWQRYKEVGRLRRFDRTVPTTPWKGLTLYRLCEVVGLKLSAQSTLDPEALYRLTGKCSTDRR